jgi:hypothetical protein
MRLSPKVGLLSLIFSLSLVSSQSVQAQCGGTERWAVKVGADPGAGNVDLANRIPRAVTDLVGLPEPHRPPAGDNTTRQSEETHVYVVTGHLIEFKFETDNDYHMVITDDTLNFTAGGSAPTSGHSFVAEIPDPNCIVGAHGNSPPNSLFIDSIRSARQKLESQFPNIDKSGAFNDAGGIPVQIIGIGFFDFPHRQVGRAPNNIEIHPVLDIVFNPPQTVGSFSISAIPFQVWLAQGGATSPVVMTMVTRGFNSAIALSVSGTPPNGIATLSPTSIPAPGGGSSTLSLSADLSTPPGNYSLTVAGNGGGMTQAATIALTVVAATPPPAVSITFPANGATVSGAVNIVAAPTGAGAVKLELYIDGDLKACNFGAASISYPWDTGLVTGGAHTIFSKAYNAAGSASTSSTFAVTVFH